MTMLQNMTGLTGAKITDQVIASDMLAAGKLGCISLTLATLESATPELRQFYQESLNESLREHEQLSHLARERGWYNSYGSPDEQLQQEMKLSEPVVKAAKQD